MSLDVSARMKRVKQRDTGPEMVVRRTCHRMGYRYCLQRRDLPGSPDLVFPARGKVIFVHGCFWHRHENGCSRATFPKTNRGFWEDKFRANAARDRRVLRVLRRLGWSVAVLWECQTANLAYLEARLRRFLGPSRRG